MLEDKIAIIGGLGHVGLPLGLVFADVGKKVCLVDIDAQKAEVVRSGNMPFVEFGSEPILKKVLENGKLDISLNLEDIANASTVIITIGTPVDEYLNPKVGHFLQFIEHTKQHLNEEQLIVIRSTIYPRTCERALKILEPGNWKVAYCPERIVQGYSITELRQLPQVIAGLSDQAYEEAKSLFEHISPKIIRASIGEAELVKLFSNAWRYIQFATANQFYMIANGFGVSYDNVREAMRDGYERAIALPGAGFAAGPCLLKDTMQLSAFSNNQFQLGHAAMLVNEGLPNYVVEQLRRTYDLSQKTVGILGMSFKANIDDTRDALSFKLEKILKFYGAKVVCSDEVAKDERFVSKEEVLNVADIVIIGVPHTPYAQLPFTKDTDVVDLWGITSPRK